MVTAESVAAAAPKYLGTPYSKMDCQAFWEACLRDAGISLNLPGSNAWYREMTWTGTPEECVRLFGAVPAGACLFILKQDGREPAKYQTDGIGNASHIGIASGGKGDGAYHSSSSRGGVVTSKFAGRSINGGWNRVGLWSKLSYTEKIDKFLREWSGQADPVTVTPTVPQPAYTGGATVTSPNGGRVNVRQKPDGAKLAQLAPGTPVEIVEQQGGWSRVQYQAEGWIMTKFLSEGVG